MTDKFISSIHIQKLGHQILEIRERALFNIISKIDNGVLFDNDLARSREILTKLFKWFLFEPCTQEEAVFSLLKRILKSDSGKILISHCGKSTLKQELSQIRSYIEPIHYPHLDELCNIINEVREEQPIVPPFECEVPLSYRTGASSANRYSMPTVGTTASAIEGYVKKDSSVEQQMGVENLTTFDSLHDETALYSPKTGNDATNGNILPNYVLKWQPLIETDKHVLQSVENSLKDPPRPSVLLHSCEFFVNVLLHDFPAEVFLQRPAFILELYSLMTCGSTRITNAVLNCFCDLTKALHLRINHCNDVAMQNHKVDLLCQPNPVHNTVLSDLHRNSENDEISSGRSEKLEQIEDVKVLQKNQLSVPKYCFVTVATIFEYLCVKQDSFRENKVKTNQVGINLSLLLLEKILDLLCLTIRRDIWDQKQNEATLKVLKEFNEMLVQYGEALEYFRVESVTSETNLTFRVIYLYLLHNTANLLKKLVPLSRTGLILPRNLKQALSNSLLDVTLGRLYPVVHNIIFEYVQSYIIDGEVDPLKKYKDVKKICHGMTATVKFLKGHKSQSTLENIKLAREALPSLDFHKDLNFLRVLVDICSEKFTCLSDEPIINMVEDVILSLLSHNLMEVSEEMYRLCQKKVVTNIGPKLNMSSIGEPGSQVLFLLMSKILVEISAFGLTSQNIEIRRYAEDILIYILKCKVLVCESVWNKVIEALIPSIPIIACHSNKNSALGKSIISLMDPDTATDIFIPPIVMLKCNIQFLFSKDAYLRDEAFSRICWLMASQENSRDMLPKFNTLYDKALANVCYLKRVVDINKIRYTEHFYQPSSLHQVMEVLNSQNVEPVLRRSALNQVSVMMEDPLLHQIFLDANGIELVTNIMKTALAEQDYRDYPDSIIPIATILKNICLYHSNVREELSTSMETLYCILRGLFLYFTEERMRQDATALLFLLIFKDYVMGSPSKATFSLPDIVCNSLHVPFVCTSHWTVSIYTKEDLKASITSDRWCLSSIQIQWNAETFGGFEELIKWDDINYDDDSMINFVADLKLSNYDLNAIKSSCISFCIKKYLNTVQNATSHKAVMDSVDYLTLYIFLYNISKRINTNNDEDDEFLSHPWEQTFLRFTKSLPSCADDGSLLKNVIKLFTLLIPFYKGSERECWIIRILKDSNQCILDLLCIDSTTDEENKVIGQELLKLITVCVTQEQHYLDYYAPCFEKASKPWGHIIKIIADNLRFSDAQHFYNLAYLDTLLSCLVHLTASLGWSNSKPNSKAKEPISQMIPDLCELVGAFHCGKGPSAAVSVMGLSITRHVLLILNHLLAELQNSRVKGWEVLFFDDYEKGNLLRSFVALWASRDTVLRAAALQLFSGLATSPRAAVEIANEHIYNNIWELAFTIVLDHTEANIVRENAVQLLANLAGHTTPLSSDKLSTSNILPALKKNYTRELLKLLEEFDFYYHLDIILNNLFTIRISDNINCHLEESGRTGFKGIFSSDNSSGTPSENSERSFMVTTPGFVKGSAVFLYNIINLAPEDVSNKLQEKGLVKLLFRVLCSPSMSVCNTKELSLYCDILEMNTVICSVLNRLARCDSVCLGTILHTKDCLNVMLSLLNHRIFHVHLPQLIYLRNKLWIEIFNLIATLAEYADDNEDKFNDRSVEVLSIFSETLLELGNEPFFETLCESISCLQSNDLQNSALTSLTSLLRVETHRAFEKPKFEDDGVFESPSLQTLLDSVKTPRTVVMSESKENMENITPLKDKRKNGNKYSYRSSEMYKMNLLEEAYFGTVFPNKLGQGAAEDIEVSFIENNSKGLMAGGEICKILLYFYDICDLNTYKDDAFIKKKGIVIAALTSLLCISMEAKKYALQKGLVQVVIKQLRDYHIRLSLESVECIRRVADKKRVYLILKEVNDLIGLLTNFMVNDEFVKTEVATLNLADVIHKLWVWFLLQNIYLVDVLRMLCTYTTGCSLACQSMPLTSSVAGSGPRKTPSNVSLLHAIITLIVKEMDQVSKTHNIKVLELSFNILHNCCESLECRVLISKSNLFQSITRLHPAITKRQKPWETIELIWLEFLLTFTTFPEGQAAVAKIADALELTMSLTSSTKANNRLTAMLVLRNLSFYQPNRPRLLSSGDFLNVLQTKLMNGSNLEKTTVVVIIWALAANSQRAKIVLKSANLDSTLQNAIKHCQLLSDPDSKLNSEDLDRMYYVLNLLRDDKIR